MDCHVRPGACPRYRVSLTLTVVRMHTRTQRCKVSRGHVLIIKTSTNKRLYTDATVLRRRLGARVFYIRPRLRGLCKEVSTQPSKMKLLCPIVDFASRCRRKDYHCGANKGSSLRGGLSMRLRSLAKCPPACTCTGLSSNYIPTDGAAQLSTTLAGTKIGRLYRAFPAKSRNVKLKCTASTGT